LTGASYTLQNLNSIPGDRRPLLPWVTGKINPEIVRKAMECKFTIDYLHHRPYVRTSNCIIDEMGSVRCGKSVTPKNLLDCSSGPKRIDS
jgi:hypothetical protein